MARTVGAPRGRPREFDMDGVLAASVRVFCERGFHGTSIADLAEATGLTVGSLYKAFADKDAMYLAALEWQSSLRDAQLRDALEGCGSGCDKVRKVLEFIADLSCGATGLEGCLVVETAVGMGVLTSEASRVATRSMGRRHSLIIELIEFGKADGSIPATVKSGPLADTMLYLTQGMRVMGKTGPAAETLASVVATAMALLD
jgi:TetR/AcrR family transcriptional regulator, transcriptional repressor for nem operon